MRRPWTRILIVLAILGSAHYYIWARFIAAARLPLTWHVIATAAMLVLAPSLPVGVLFLRRLPRSAARPYVWLTFTWFGLAVYLLLAAALTHLAMRAVRGGRADRVQRVTFDRAAQAGAQGRRGVAREQCVQPVLDRDARSPPGHLAFPR